MLRRHAREAAVLKAGHRGVIGMNIDLRFGGMRAQPRALSGARHGVPLIAQASGIEAKRKSLAGRRSQLRKFRRDETAAPIAGEKSAVGEETLFAAFGAFRQRPHHRIQQVVVCIGEAGEPPKSKSRCPSFSNADSAACSRKISAGPR